MWSFTNDKPVYVQIIDELMSRIASGVYQPGERIPSVRDLAEEARVNPNTMQRALAEIERSGYIISLRTSGRFITEDSELIAQLSDQRADEVIGSFCETIRKIGISPEQAIEMIHQYFAQHGGESENGK
ncbi:MAG: GntR family transcriptional regulator [Ruminococcus sp.]|nr:GntR family transcriptional regulator [Ruminococcus sp.]MBQ3856394.1 GntR family transcriptional regulator [Ruminococcus sp.]MBQ8123795.1 GntR family transcriptional regulator [Ruminococcus sp.]HBB20140.1 GntR family transcriptional regulator [Ruminococcus sp.]